MKAQFSKLALTATLAIAITFTLSCSGGDDNDTPHPRPAISSSGGSSSSGESSPSGGSSSSGNLECGTWSEWVVTTAPTCEAEGEKTRTCTSDPSTETETLAKLEYVWEVTTSASSTALGEETGTCPGNVSLPKTRPLYPKCGETEEYNPVIEQCCGNNKYAVATQFCYNSSKVGNFCGINPQKYYDPGIYKCINGKDGIYLKTGITDSRDSNTYDAVLIGTQTWMAENLNYNTNTTGSKCYADGVNGVFRDSIDKNCATYGRLYDWATAMKIDASCNTKTITACGATVSPSNHQGVCPSGWHIPSDGDWDVLMTAVGGSSTAGTKLKAKNGWKSNGNGIDIYGFSALPGGNGVSSYFLSVGNTGYWWSASEYLSDGAYSRKLTTDSQYAYYDRLNKISLFSVRCLQDQD